MLSFASQFQALATAIEASNNAAEKHRNAEERKNSRRASYIYRQKILSFLTGQEGTVNEIAAATGMHRSTACEHLRTLHLSGKVTMRNHRGRRVFSAVCAER